MIWEENEVKFLGITIDNKLKLDSHILNICSKANRKLSILCFIKCFKCFRLKTILTFQLRRILFKSLFKAQFRYDPLT